jgi:cell fate regulator YaaT (PSP1 superfamily)
LTDNEAAPLGVIEVRFKGARKEYVRESADAPLAVGDHCIVRTERGRECGQVSQTGDVPALKAREKPVGDILRRATDDDMRLFRENVEKEARARGFCHARIETRRLEMKLVDVEWQFDSSKVTFYFTADRRVDFRELVKDLAAEFRTRIELRQIGVRDEAKRKDGYGSCGRRLCCSSWLPEFQPITLKMARDQSLTVSPNKISGLCGRLLCCLSYEVEQYRDVLRSLPPVGALVKAGSIEGIVTKVDVFNRRLTVRGKDDRDSFIPENAWRPEFLVANRAPRPGGGGRDEGEGGDRGERGTRSDRAGRGGGRPREHPVVWRGAADAPDTHVPEDDAPPS